MAVRPEPAHLLAVAMVAAFAVVAVACGGRVSPDAAAPEDAGTPVPRFGDTGPTTEVPVACEPCAADDDCDGPQYACVASMGAPFCAPGCSKDGFCNPEQTCTWVVDPAGQRWRACIAGPDPCVGMVEGPRRAR
jgi:hypothetical protein